MTLELDPDRRISLAYVSRDIRPAMEALWRLDVSLGSVLASGREPMISQIRLAWWRESLQKLDRARAPAEPALQAVEAHLLPRGISGEELSRMEEGWAVLVSPEPLGVEELGLFARARGAGLFSLSARLFGTQAPAYVQSAGERWALVDLARHSGEPDSSRALDVARTIPADPRWPSALRPIGMLSMLASRDLDPATDGMELQGSPRRLWRMFRHRLSGR